MHRLKKIFEFYVRASIHVAFAVIAFVYLTGQFLNISVSTPLYFFVFFSTIPSYNLIKHLAGKENRFYGVFSMDRTTLVLSLVSMAIAGYYVTDLSCQTLMGVLGLTFLTAVYALPILPRGRNLRHTGIVKILLIGLVWAGTTVLLPALEATYPVPWDAWVEFTQRFLMILVLMVPFEIRDLGTDPSDMLTIPQRLGIGKTRRIGIWICFVCFLLSYAKDDLLSVEILAKGGMVLSLIGLLLLLPKRQKAYFASFWVEAFPVFWAVGFWAVTALV